jgi:hypothetical protein
MPRASDVRESVLGMMQRLRASAERAVALPHAGEDARTLAEAAENLKCSVVNLTRVVDQHEALLLWAHDVAPKLDESDLAKLYRTAGGAVINGLVDLSSAISAAMTIGNLALKSPIVERELKALQSARAAAATQQKLTDSRGIDDVIGSEAAPIWKKHPSWTPNRVATMIRDSVNRELSALKLDPLAIDAIRKRVSKLRTNGRLSA